MKPNDDIQLLNSWRRSRNRAAMDELIRRHIHFVYGAACRIMGDRSTAEDVTQAVFMLLIQKSPRINNELALTTWLHRTTRFASSNARRMNARSAARDRRFARPEMQHSEAFDQIDRADKQAFLLPLLDDAIGALASSDRHAILMCYFHERSYREIGEAIGVSEDAARKRLERAVDRLRSHLRSRGLVADAGVVTACLMRQPLRALTQLIHSTLKIAPATDLATRCYPSAQIAQKMMHTMMMFKMKLAAAACAAIVAGAALTAGAIHTARADSNRAIVAEDSDLVVKLDDKVEIGLLAVAKSDAGPQKWFTPAGKAIDHVPGRLAQETHDITEDNRKLLFHVSSTVELPSINFEAPHTNHPHLLDLNDGERAMEYVVYYNADEKAGTSTVTILVGDGEWQQVCDAKIDPAAPMAAFESKAGDFTFTPVLKSPRGAARVYMSHHPLEGAWRVCAIDAAGQSHECVYDIQNQAGNICTDVMDFPLAPKEVVSFSVETRPFNRRVTVKNLANDPSHPAKPTVRVENAK